MDITEFRVIRTPVADDLDSLTLPEVVRPGSAVGGGAANHVDPPADPITVSTLPPEFGSPDLDPLAALTTEQLDVPLQRLYFVLQGANLALTRSADWMSGDSLADRLSDLRKMARIADDDWPLGARVAQICLTDRIVVALEANTPEEYGRSADLTRLALLCDLVARGDGPLRALAEADVSTRLNERAVILPERVTDELRKRSRVKLIRDATVSDLHVIRREWASYILGEVANVRNLMAGESFTLTNTQLDEQEAVTTSDVERDEVVEQEDSSKLSSELSNEISSQIDLSVNGYFDASVQYNAPVATINVGGGANVSLSMQRNEKFASKVAREAVARALRRVDTRTRETRSQRELSRTKDVTSYEVHNPGGNVHAVYRWVDRVDRFQLFRYPHRLQLEFQLPEPAEFYRRRTQAAAGAAAGVDRPPETFDLTLADITGDRLVELAVRYRASNLPAMPDETIGLTRAFAMDVAKEAMPTTSTEINAATQSKELDIAIPTNYCATSVTYSGHGYPVWGKWRVGSTTVGADLEGFHSGFAAVSIGDRTMVDWVGGFRKNGAGGLEFLSSHGDVQDKGSADAVQDTDQPGNTPVRSVPYGRAALVIGQDPESDLQPDPSMAVTLDPGVTLSLKVGVSTAGLSGCAVTFFVTCTRTGRPCSAGR